jgi:cob(I)alamin adenosyltransferase
MESVTKSGPPYRIYASVDEMNARAVGRLAGKDLQQLLDMARQWQTRLVQAARALADPTTPVLVMGDGSGRSGLQRLETIVQHWNERVRELQALSAA